MECVAILIISHSGVSNLRDHPRKTLRETPRLRALNPKPRSPKPYTLHADQQNKRPVVLLALQPSTTYQRMRLILEISTWPQPDVSLEDGLIYIYICLCIFFNVFSIYLEEGGMRKSCLDPRISPDLQNHEAPPAASPNPKTLNP